MFLNWWMISCFACFRYIKKQKNILVQGLSVINKVISVQEWTLICLWGEFLLLVTFENHVCVSTVHVHAFQFCS